MDSLDNNEPSEGRLDDTQSQELSVVDLPGQADIAALEELAKSMEKASGDTRAAAAIEKGLLKDLAPVFDPRTRQDPPGRQNSISAGIVADFAVLLECFNAAATALGYNPPAPNQRRYKGPRLQLRYCRIDRCDMSMQPIRWSIDLCGSRFQSPAMFMGATFAADAGFEHCSFESGADFGLAKFQGDANFSGVSFASKSTTSATFAAVTFCRQADFELTHFASDVQFDYGTFEGRCRFFRCRFGGRASFAEVKFLQQSQFEFSSFAGDADFNGAAFLQAPDFHQARFAAAVDFSDTNFEQYLDLRTSVFQQGATLTVADLRIRASNVLGGNVRLRSDQLRRRSHRLGVWHSLIEADSSRKIKAAARRKRDEALAKNTPDALQQGRRQYDKVIKGKLSALACACTQYGVLEENFRAQGDPDSRTAEDFCHYRYHNLRRQIHIKPYNPSRWANWIFLKICFGYGVYPLRILAAGIMLIIVFACMYATAGFGLSDGNWNIISAQTVETTAAQASATGVSEKTVSVRLSQLSGWEKWGTALYFSTITFTTVGYGDWIPSGAAQIAAGSEALLGVLLMSIFTVVFARKFIR